jgi:dolichol kinase
MTVDPVATADVAVAVAYVALTTILLFAGNAPAVEVAAAATGAILGLALGDAAVATAGTAIPERDLNVVAGMADAVATAGAACPLTPSEPPPKLSRATE